jgi:hypothetical protein
MRVTRLGLTAAFSAALFGTTTLDTTQAADAVRLTAARRFAARRGTKSGQFATENHVRGDGSFPGKLP